MHRVGPLDRRPLAGRRRRRAAAAQHRLVAVRAAAGRPRRAAAPLLAGRRGAARDRPRAAARSACSTTLGHAELRAGADRRQRRIRWLSPNSCHRYPFCSAERRSARAALAGDRLEHQQVRRLGLVPAGDQSVDDAHAALGIDHQRRSTPRRGRTRPVAPRRPSPARGRRSCRPRSRGRRAARVRSTSRAVAAGTEYCSGNGGSWRSGELTPVCSVIGATAIPRGDQRGDQLGRERPAGARHLGAARAWSRTRSDRRASGHAAAHVAVPDRLARAPSRQLLAPAAPSSWASSRRAPEAYGRDELQLGGAAGERRSSRRRARGPGATRRRCAARPRASARRGRARGWRSARAPGCRRRRAPGDRRGQRRRDVDDDQVAGLQQLGAARESGRGSGRRRPRSATSSRTRRGPGRAPRAARWPRSRCGSSKAERAHDGAPRRRRARAPGSARSAARRRSAPAAPARSSSGSGRSEMSSPGNASWCMRVRMSPGSTA